MQEDSSSIFQELCLHAKRTWPGIFLVVYVWLQVTTPYHRFDIFGAIHFEKLLFFALAVAVMFQAKKASFSGFIPVLFVVITVFQWVSFAGSDYSDFGTSQHWKNEYWKLGLLFCCMAISLQRIEYLVFFILGAALVSCLYQLHSWKDFLSGGSYVVQQGIVRMKGTWSGGGYGVGNAWGILAGLSVPFGVFAFMLFKSKFIKLGCIFFILMSLMSILYSGSRGSMAMCLVWSIFAARKHLYRPKVIVGLVVAALLAVSFMPEQYKNRYFKSFTADKSSMSKQELQATSSAASRINGIVDGFKMMVNEPVLGYGPGTSALARREVSKPEHVGYQMHNLFGQLMAELGVIGTILYVLLWGGGAMKMNSAYKNLDLPEEDLRVFALVRFLIISQLLMLVVYGMSGHHLYNFRWIWTYGLMAGFLYCCGVKSKKGGNSRQTV